MGNAKRSTLTQKTSIYYLVVLIVLVLSYALSRLPITSQLLKTADLRIYDTILDFDNAFLKNDKLGAYDEICIVDIDEKSISTLGQFSSWPSIFFADLVNILAQDEPLAIGFDVFFTENDSIKGYARERLSQQLVDIPINSDKILDRLSTDTEFAAALAEAGNVFLGMFSSLDSTSTKTIPDKLIDWQVTPKYYLKTNFLHPPIKMLSDAAFGLGFTHIEPDESGVIHDYPLFLKSGNRYYVNFSFQMCLDLLGVKRIESGKACNLYSDEGLIRKLPLCSNGRFYFKFYGKQKSFRYVSFSDVLLNRIPKGFFEDRIILIGSSASGLRDIKTTPLDQNYPGVELHATLIRNVLESTFVHWLNPNLIFIVNLMLMGLLALLVIKTKPLVSIFVYLLLSVIIFIVFFMLYSMQSISLSYTSILMPWLTGFKGLVLSQAHLHNKEKRMVRNAFEHYVSKDVINEIMKGSQSLAPGGEKKTISIMFTDIRSFTTLCERLSPDEITSFVNRYFNLCTEIIVANRGLLDKYIGDAILGLFGAPVEYPAYAMNAVKSAIEIREVAKSLRIELANHPVLSEFNIGVGIATGEVIVGNIGSDRIFNYTGIGDRMNFSSRLESLNKFYLTSIIIDDTTCELVRDSFTCRKLDRVKVKGKKIETDIYEVIDYTSKLNPDNPTMLCYRKYETALALMASHRKQEAISMFNEALQHNPTDNPCKIMIERCQTMDWDAWNGTWQHDNK
ncbi:MAG: adenylate/guanylate cyclase domain-containing protein [Candidatus Cloacimonetes bacterium]|nr:adenylate/guanylate cyclase domain-containing protein [Candidatus Cloacimonadota bacterium]